MRRITAAAALLIFIAVSIFVGNIVINKQCDILSDDIENVKNSINKDKMDIAASEIEAIKNVWHKRKAILSVFSNHGPLDEITIGIEELKAAAEAEDKALTLLKCAQISALVGRITEEQRIHAESFF